jgi:hypothetical protein
LRNTITASEITERISLHFVSRICANTIGQNNDTHGTDDVGAMSARLAAWEPLSAWLVCVRMVSRFCDSPWLAGWARERGGDLLLLNGVRFLRHARAWKLIGSEPGMRQPGSLAIS